MKYYGFGIELYDPLIEKNPVELSKNLPHFKENNYFLLELLFTLVGTKLQIIKINYLDRKIVFESIFVFKDITILFKEDNTTLPGLFQKFQFIHSRHLINEK